jgi:hypothetical protein
VALIAIALLAIGGWVAARALWASRSARWWGAAVIVAAALQSMWIIVMRPLDPSFADSEGVRNLGAGTALRTSFGESLNRLREMVGWFGWLDAPAPGLTYALWAIVFGVLLGLALVAWRRRFLVVAGAAAIVTVAAPLVFETVQAHQVGFFWQGRYSMPLALGVPVLLALSVALPRATTVAAGAGDDPVLNGSGVARLVGAVAVAVVIGHVAAFGQALRRNTVGYNGPLDFLVHPDWEPPVPAWLLALLFTVTVAAFVWWVTSTPRVELESIEPEPADQPTPSGSLRYS